ncbi:MAG: orotidine-5'-phosphate decarboxylase [Hyphomicrobiales bacterium]|nr:orotidine-5'-phosphate decarboxylase [Hyphomicrobiales bacterium]
MTGRAALSRIALALDFSTPDDARRFIDRIEAPPIVYKIGVELIYAGGLALADELARSGHAVFIDAKLHDIGRTVERATAVIAGMGAQFLTVHAADRKTLAGAVRGRSISPLKLLGVTVMTNLDAADLAEQGLGDPAQAARRRAAIAREEGLDGVVASAWEAPEVKRLCGAGFLVVTPGVRPAGSAAGDQARVATPAEAVRAGADYLVVGRPITESADPKAALAALASDIETAAQA